MSLIFAVLMTFSAIGDSSCRSNSRSNSWSNSQPSSLAASQFESLKSICQAVQPTCLLDSSGDKLKKELSGSTAEPEKKIEELTSSLSDKELFKRLVYAETLAARCTDKGIEAEVASAIAWTIQNRMSSQKKMFGLGRKVITQPFQFRSSLGLYEGSMRNEFLCPSVDKDPQSLATWKAAEKAVSEIETTTNPYRNVYHYYLKEHFKGTPLQKKYEGQLPAWASKASPVIKDPKLAHCIELYRDVP